MKQNQIQITYLKKVKKDNKIDKWKFLFCAILINMGGHGT